jgi:hypothetical protein
MQHPIMRSADAAEDQVERPQARDRGAAHIFLFVWFPPCNRIVPSIKGQARVALSLRQNKRLSPYGRTFRFLLPS